MRNIISQTFAKIKSEILYNEFCGDVMQKLRPDLDIGHNIGALRRAAGLTQEQTVAKMQLMGLEISKSTYAKLETNRMNIKVSELVALKQIFAADFNAFFEHLV